MIADTTFSGRPAVAATLGANPTAVSPITAWPFELVVTCWPVVVTVSTATPIVLPLGLALVVAPVVFTPVDDTVTVVLEFALVLEVVEEVKKYFKDKVFTTMIPRNIRLAEAPSYGMSALSYDKNSKGSIAYTRLAEEFL